MQLQYFASPSLVCNDGSPAGYYLRPGHGSCGQKRFVLHLQGGGMCFDADSCRERWDETALAGTQDLMRSTAWPQTRLGAGIQSPDAGLNPDFHSWWHVFVPYCSSDFWTGDHQGSNDPISDDDWHFRGHPIFEAVLTALDPEGMSTAELVILSGSSAGGVGVMANVDNVASRYPVAHVLGINDAGWILDIEPLEPELPTPLAAVTLGANLWEGSPDASCATVNADQLGRCYIGPFAIGEVTTPVLVQQSQRDPAHLRLLGVEAPYNLEDLTFVTAFAEQVRLSLAPLAAAFSPRTLTHGILVDAAWASTTAADVTFREMVGRFVFSRDGPMVVIEAP